MSVKTEAFTHILSANGYDRYATVLIHADKFSFKCQTVMAATILSDATFNFLFSFCVIQYPHEILLHFFPFNTYSFAFFPSTVTGNGCRLALNQGVMGTVASNRVRPSHN